MPNLDNIRLWVAALRSGEYQQGFSALHRPEDNTFCCLGVACDVARKNGLDLPSGSNGGESEYFGDEAAFLPLEVQRWLGIGRANPAFTDDSGISHMATEWNDGYMASFSEIARAIRNTYLRGETV